MRTRLAATAILVLGIASAGAFGPIGPLTRSRPALHTRPRALAMSAELAVEPAAEEDAITEECDISQPTLCDAEMPPWLRNLAELQERGVGSVALLVATAVSLTLANVGRTAAWWLPFWSTPVGPAIGGHALSPRGWINEGLMAVFFFVVGLEIKQELRLGSLSSVKKALLPCIAAVGGMVTPMAVYLAVQLLPMMGGGSLAALTVPMATDIAFAMAIFGFFRSRMPPSASVFLLTLATVDDLGAIFVLATCFASHVYPGFLAAAAGVTAALTWMCKKRMTDMRLYSAGGAALWWCLLRSGISADVAGVLAALCVSTRAVVRLTDGGTEHLTERLITRLSPLSTFFIMPAFALANTAVPLGGLRAAAAGAASTTVAPAAGIGLGLLLGKPLGIFGATWLAIKLGAAQMPEGMRNSHLGVVSVLGAIGFTMCLLLTEVSMPPLLQPIPKLAVLVSSLVASVVAAGAMARMRPVEAATPADESPVQAAVQEAVAKKDD